MKPLQVARSLACICVAAAAAVGCGKSDCAGVGVEYFPPTDTTVALHETIVLAAGTGGRCNGGPVTFGTLTHWHVGDSTIVSVVVVDSVHAQINGLATGTTTVMASANGFFGSTTIVTVH